MQATSEAPEAQTDLTIAELRRQVRRPNSARGFDIIPEQRLAYPMTEVGEVAREVLRLSGDGDENVGGMDPAQREAVVENVGMEIYDALWNLLDLAGVEDPEGAFARKAALNERREWSRTPRGGRR